VEYVLQTTLVKEKTKQTYLKKYGVEHNTQIFNYEENRKQTCLKKYGVEYVLQTTLVKEKTKQSCLKKYGVEHASQSEKIREKQKQTNLKRYGVEWNITSKHSREKQKQTKLEKYGIEHVHQKHIMDILHLLRDYNWLYNQYINKKKSITQIAEELNINGTTLGNYLRRHNIAIKHVGGFSHKCILWLESVMESQNIFIQHTQNIGEYRIPNTRLHVDGYCEETNTIYEFYGDMWHGNPNVFESHVCCNYFSNLTAGELYQNTMEREDLIKEMGYNFIVIWEKEWDENQNT
ncbi:MAG: DUF7487 domain-containing protein, partial [Nitrosopumilaceae archaeon]